jgi:apolipoprotein N-acyltransferase
MLVIAAAAAAQPFANGRWIVPAIAWLAPMLLLRLVRARGAWRGIAVGWILFTLGWIVQWWDIINLPRAWFALAALGCGVAGFLPYCADRLIAPRLHGIASTFVFPTALATTEWLLATVTPNGSWGSLAYTQSTDLPLLQLASITGIYGISFLIAWFAATANFVWEHRHWTPLSLRAIGIFLITMIVVLAYGGARLSFDLREARALRVATIAPSRPREHDPALLAEALDDLYSRSALQAAAGAKLILWPEDSFFIYKRDEAAMLSRALRFAQQQRIYLGLSYGARLDAATATYENKMTLITPAGAIAWQYLKNHPVPGHEASIVVRGEGGPALFANAEGRFAGGICYDADFPALFHRAGRERADVLLVPADDWRAIDPIHARMTVLRGIEEGASVVRAALRGLSIATDAYGRVIASDDYFVGVDHTMVATVPVAHVATIYSLVGDLFACLCVAGLIALAAFSRQRSV